MSDLGTGNAINGATVQSVDVPTDSAKTAAVPDDPNNPGGFYFLFSSVTGSHPFTASASQHSPDTETVNVAGDNTVRQDFELGSPICDHADHALEHAGARLHGDQDADVPQRRHRSGARDAERAGRRVPGPGAQGAPDRTSSFLRTSTPARPGSAATRTTVHRRSSPEHRRIRPGRRSPTTRRRSWTTAPTSSTERSTRSAASTAASRPRTRAGSTTRAATRGRRSRTWRTRARSRVWPQSTGSFT